MDKNLKKALKFYLTNIFRKLPDSSKKRRKFIHLLKQNILDYINEKSINKIEDIYMQFGTVDEIVEAYLDDISYKYLRERIKITRMQKACMYITILTVIVGTFAYNIILYYSNKKDKSIKNDTSILLFFNQ